MTERARFTENETINLFAHSYDAEFEDDSTVDTLWSETAYQEFTTQHPGTQLPWADFHERLQKALSYVKRRAAR